MGMIEVSKINGEKIWINPELLLKCEQAPDTLLTFMGDYKLLVQETPQEIEKRIINFKQKIQNGVNL